MDVHNRPIYLRSSVLLVVFLLHGSLILVFLREKPAYRGHPTSPEVPTTIFFINPQSRLPLPAPETSRIPRRPTRNLQHRLRPDAAISSLATAVPPENQASADSPPVDWLAEAHRSASEIAARGEPGRAAQSPSSPTASAPWDLRPLLESTGHGLRLRIPVEIPGRIIDHCFGNMDLGHDLTGHWERYQLGCAFRKQPARDDLFDSLRKPSEPPAGGPRQSTTDTIVQ
jgi:hypothetical protein